MTQNAEYSDADLWRTAFATSYRIVGLVADAEDLAQDSLLKWHQVAQDNIASPRGYVARIAANLSIDHVKRMVSQREALKANWLPEPHLAPPSDVEENIDFTYAMLVALHTLTPIERAVFLLREVFDCSYREIAATLGRSEDTCRQAVVRARRALRHDRRKCDANTADNSLFRAMIEAIEKQDLEALRPLLADDVVLRTDSGGKGPALKRPLCGCDAVGRFMIASTQLLPAGAGHRVHSIGREFALVVESTDIPVLAVLAEETDGVVSTIFVISDQSKIARLTG